MISLALLCSVVILAPVGTRGQTGPISTPNLSSTIKESSEGFSLFLKLWEYSLEMDAQIPTQRATIVPKTLLLPGDFSMAHLVPLDGSHPLFLDDPKFRALRREFILDHLVLDRVLAENSKDGIEKRTLSGKGVIIMSDPAGKFLVNGVGVKKMVSLTDGSQIFVLERPLFDQTQKVRQAFNDYHQITQDDTTGPPLDIPGGLFVARDITTPRVAGPPSPPKSVRSESPVAGPPASPVAGPPASPVAGPPASPVAGPPATP